MEKRLERFKGIHPGLILERELNKRSIKPSPFALSVDTHRQIFNAILKGKRGIPIPLSLKVDQALGLEEGTFAMLQTFYDIQKVKENELSKIHPDLGIIRKILFWDTDIHKIDWKKQDKAVIQRVFERGNDEEKKEIERFYGLDRIQEVLASNKTEPMSLH
ncbi:helix-turn-helix transcriptional regulator [Sphingobacterium composti Ten et al. 2007 non Yoo et al. 2007]|uniref:helix-turn-helix transcriptional regulator n=1 Tax=Sphingobacterium composti TaxID=363260 RepID=UPI00135C220E|nr:plasmid maintenance system antidote protein [Sphingobacterium composti Ten et al. 2007 non Yoo et al. 2007]